MSLTVMLRAAAAGVTVADSARRAAIATMAQNDWAIVTWFGLQLCCGFGCGRGWL